MSRDGEQRILVADAVNLGALKVEPLRDGDVSRVPGGAFVTVSVFVPETLTRDGLPPVSACELLTRAQWHSGPLAYLGEVAGMFSVCPWCGADHPTRDGKPATQAAYTHRASCEAAKLMGWPVEAGA